MDSREIRIELFMIAEAVASCNLDTHYQTLTEGLTNNPKLHSINVTIRHRDSGTEVWRGPIAHATRAVY